MQGSVYMDLQWIAKKEVEMEAVEMEQMHSMMDTLIMMSGARGSTSPPNTPVEVVITVLLEDDPAMCGEYSSEILQYQLFLENGDCYTV